MKKTASLGYIGEHTTQLYGDYNKQSGFNGKSGVWSFAATHGSTWTGEKDAIGCPIYPILCLVSLYTMAILRSPAKS